MPKIEVIFYQDDDGSVPVLEWLMNVRRHNKKVYAKCLWRILQLESDGHELRRPASDYLRDDIYELRIRYRTANYRILYFFHGQTVAILTNGLVKEDRVPDKEIQTAIMRKERFKKDPGGHSYDKSC